MFSSAKTHTAIQMVAALLFFVPISSSEASEGELLVTCKSSNVFNAIAGLNGKTITFNDRNWRFSDYYKNRLFRNDEGREFVLLPKGKLIIRESSGEEVRFNCNKTPAELKTALSKSEKNFNTEPASNTSVTNKDSSTAKSAECSGAYFSDCVGSREFENARYVGEFQDNKLNGFGQFTFLQGSDFDGDVYEGAFKNDKFHGSGKYTHSNGDTFIGTFKNDLPVAGTYSFDDGATYIGQLLNGEFHGKGTFKFSQTSEWAGDRYIGQFKNGARSGAGRYIFADGTSVSGDWLNDELINEREISSFRLNAVQRDELTKAQSMFSDHEENALCRDATWVWEGKIEFWDTDKRKFYQEEFPQGTYAALLAQYYEYDCNVGSRKLADIACHEATFSVGNAISLDWAGTDPNNFDNEWKHLAQEAQINIQEVADKGYDCGVNNEFPPSIMVAETNTNSINQSSNRFSKTSNLSLCFDATYQGINGRVWHEQANQAAVREARRRGLDCDVNEAEPSQSQSPTIVALQKEADRLKLELERLRSQQTEEQQLVETDTQIPLITASSQRDSEANALIVGKVVDDVEVAEVTVDGEPVQLTSDGSFEISFYVPRNGKVVEIVAFDKKGNKATKTLNLERGSVKKATGPVFASLNPSGKRVARNKNALALIIGVADYERTPAKAAYADRDAQTFYDYAMLKLGIPAGNIKELVNTDADEVDVRLAVKDWIARTTKQGKSDVYVFFAGHGLAAQSGDEMYLLPHDGEPRLLEDTAISRESLFSDIALAKPRSVTVFLDTCYSGTTRGTDMLVASRPIAIRAKQQNIPDGFTVFTAAGGDQTAKPLEEAKHGMFSYFLMKGMEGDADSNQDNQITAAELHEYVEQNVVQQSGGSQVPELQGDASRILVRFQ